jgi:hypothetical protein
MHLDHPVPQAVHQELKHVRIDHVQRVSAPAEVHVIARIVGQQPIIGGIINSPETERRSEMISFGAVIVDDVENHLDAG